jgi:signal peptidase I
MLASLWNRILESLSDISNNPLSLIILALITALIVSLLIASVSTTWRKFLVRSWILEENEPPTSLLVWVIGIILAVQFINVYVVQSFIVDGGSMLPTFHDKEFLLVDKLSYRIDTPHRGDVAIFKFYEGTGNQYEGKYLIKRIIGLPGERIVVQNGVTTIYNTEHPEGLVIDESYVTHRDLTKNVDTTLGDHQYFMMGDNRAQSYDSRLWGPLDEQNLRGQVLFRVYPFGSAGYEPGRHVYTN